jgi:hypothetical protein
MPRGITVSGTSASVTASGGTLGVHITGVPNYLNIMKVKIQPSGGSGPYSLEIFSSDTLAAGSLLAKWQDATGNIYDPMNNSGGGPAEGLPSDFVVAYEDTDGTGELHLKFTNNDSVNRTYTYTIVYESASRSGTYTPTFLSSVNNETVPTLVGVPWYYTRVGNVVTFAGHVSINPLVGGGTFTQISFSLPFFSELTSFTELSGVGVMQSSTTSQGPAAVTANTASNIANMSFIAASASTDTWGVTGMYLIV